MSPPASETVLVDTNVFVYLASDSPYQKGSAAVVEALGAGSIAAVIEELCPWN